MVRPLNENQGSSPLQGHSSWLMCEVALRSAIAYEFALILSREKRGYVKGSIVPSRRQIAIMGGPLPGGGPLLTGPPGA
jgi:hypothetical protein